MNTPSPFESRHDGQKRTIYVLVRTDISVEQQLVQAAHAAAEASREFYADHHGIASLIMLAVANKAELLQARDRLAAKSLETALFFEPDFDMGYSALATRPLLDAERKLLRQWPLWALERARSVSAQEEAQACS